MMMDSNLEVKIMEAIKRKDYLSAKEYIEQYIQHYLLRLPYKEAYRKCKQLYLTLERVNAPSTLLIPLYLFLLRLRKIIALIRIYKKL